MEEATSTVAVASVVENHRNDKPPDKGLRRIMTFENHKAANTSVAIHAHLANRWSPRGFSTSHEMSDEELQSLLEAARWTPSCSNTQPWRFIVGRRGDATFQRILDNLKPNNQTWAQHASTLLMVCAVTTDDAGNPQRWAEYDAGQAVASMTIQASEIGLHMHQMAGFEVDGIREAFSLPASITPVTAVAIGEFNPDADLPEVLAERERAPRQRLSVEELLIS